MTRLQTIVIDRVTLYNCPSYHLRALDSMPLSQLRYLALPHISSSSNGIETLLEICQAAKGLRHLDLIDSELEDEDVKALADSCLSLRTLDLSRNELVTFKDFFPVPVRAQDTQPWLLLPSSVVVAAAEAPDSERHAVLCTHRGPYPRSTTTPKHDNNIIHSNNNGININDTADSASSLESFPEGHSLQPTELQQEEEGGRGEPIQKMIKRPGSKKSRLLEEDQPFMHLKELSLVFCFGIANSEFQTLFRALCPQNLSSLNLQFTHIEDSGLETLAAVGGDSLTSLSVSYCSQITARGLRALVQNCVSLLELEFLSCDQVSSDCFLGPTPWACKRLKRLEFTFHPTVLFAVNNNNNCETKEAGLASDNSGLVDGQCQEQTILFSQQGGQTTTTTTGATLSTLAWSGDQPAKELKQTPKEHELCNNGDIYSPEVLEVYHPHPHQGHCANDERSDHRESSLFGEDDRKESSFQQAKDQPTQGRASIPTEYHAMFRQLKQLSHLRSLHIYNSPLLSGNSSGPGDQEYGESSAEEAGMAMTASTEVMAPSNTPTVVEAEEEEEDPQQDTGSGSNSISNGSNSGYSSGHEYHVDSSHRTDTEMSAPFSSMDRPERRIRSRAPTGVQIPPGPWTIPLTAFSASRSGSADVVKDTGAPIHPFSLRMGLKALGGLRELEALTLYERQPMTIGEKEVKWMSKALPQLVKLQLRGAIEISDRAQRRMKTRRPSVRVQVCSLFENVCL